MKIFTLTISFLIATVSLSLNTAFAQNDNVYIMKNGSVIGKYNVANIDSIIFYKPVVEGITGTFTDPRDNTVYKWVKIGNQVWMSENLRYLPSVVGPTVGSNSEPYYYVYGYAGSSVAEAKATENYVTYGVLYNWTAAMNGAASSTVNPSGVRGICPAGWHLPSDAEWQQLEMHLGMTEEQTYFMGWRGTDEGGKLKEAGTAHWTYPNEGATNESGFSALPGGYRNYDGGVYDVGSGGVWWSATEYDGTNAWYRYIYYGYSLVYRIYYYNELGYSVRCLRD
ncbi:MAG TPA: FISUMP domain-containing protein [Salinivirgaceae bacterium]|nr:FISUMP domain-containing protein [Salinivirgaceae bacterium]HQA76158.1 FISUMP domain-containing protein [Salinivirgaceae bacterium]